MGLFLVAHVKSNIKEYLSLDPIFTTNKYFYHVLDEDYFHQISLMHSEGGLFINILDSIKEDSINFFKKENRLYHTTKEYVDDVVSFDNLGIGNFNGIFKIYFAFCFIILLVFVIQLIINFISSRKERNRRWTTEFTSIREFKKLFFKNKIVFCLKSIWI